VGKFRYLALGAAAMMLTSLTPAYAGYLSGVEVEYWSYDGAVHGTDADLANYNIANNIAPDAMFFYNGPVNWVWNGAQSGPNLVSSFLNMADVTAFLSPSTKFSDATAFGNDTMSVAGDSQTALFAVSGNASFSTLTINHDDGVSAYLDGSTTAFISSASETAFDTSTGVGPYGNHDVLLTYIEGNGAPSVLQVTAAPEPSTWAMMLAGFAGLAFAGYRSRKTAAAAI
jgi:PEP-CTERM motif